MKRYPTLVGGMALVATVAFALLATAQETTTRTARKVETKHHMQGSFGKLDSVTQGSHFRASQLIGANIYNTNEDSVGEIKDIVLDASNGQISYAAVTYGGFLGIGDKMFAVPWEAFEVRADKDDPNDHHLCLDVSQQRLDGAQGFDQDKWPNFADRNFAQELDRRYGVDRTKHRRNRDGKVDVNVNRNGVDVDVDRNN